ncbi:hypothetical protein ZWY2020_053203 [Hordeum vulgare]|nr:hypothetical protein ZWY2020_053203 [Hordeum vulgare]
MGEIPPSIGCLRRLQTLFPSNNTLQGSIPTSLAYYSSLKVQWLNNNGLDGQIPADLLPSLQQLQLSKNDIRGTSVRMLSCVFNRIEGSIPDELAELGGLEILYLGSNLLAGNGEVPPDIGNSLPNLQILSLAQNFFHRKIPNSFVNAFGRRVFDISTDNFTRVVPSSIGRLSKLDKLNIEMNKLQARNKQEWDFVSSLANCTELHGLSLASNLLEGQVPNSLGNLSIHLQYLFLGQNRLAGSFPSGIADFPNLIILGLDCNRFTGLSTNMFTGNIPSSLSNLSQLIELLLDTNQFNGHIPTTDLHLPACFVTSSDLSKHRLSVILKVAIPLACMLSLLTMEIFALLWQRKNHLKRSMSSLSFDGKFPKVSYKDLARATDGFLVSNLIGTGRYSSVYRGKILQEENEVAVKVFCLETRGAQRSFIAECNALRNVRHRNLVCISTACSSIDSSENDFKALVYEFMRGGDSHNLLYSMEDNGNSLKRSYLSLAQRLSIVVDVADAMEYLHDNHHGSIVHCDLKPSNILLDNDMVAHVGDFGLARLQVYPVSSSFGDSTSVSLVAIRGTRGYVAPEYGSGGQVSTAVDVYSFGVVLLEIFIRKSPTDGMFKDGLSIAKFAEVNFLDKMMQIVDPQLVQELDLCEEAPSSKDIGVHCLLSVMNVCLCCTKSSPSEHLSMEEVAGVKQCLEPVHQGRYSQPKLGVVRLDRYSCNLLSFPISCLLLPQSISLAYLSNNLYACLGSEPLYINM